MLLGTRHNLANPDAFAIYLDDTITQEVNTQNLLGKHIERNLTWDSRIDTVCPNITRNIIFMNPLSKYVDKHSLIKYYTNIRLWVHYLVQMYSILQLPKKKRAEHTSSHVILKPTWLCLRNYGGCHFLSESGSQLFIKPQKFTTAHYGR